MNNQREKRYQRQQQQQQQQQQQHSPIVFSHADLASPRNCVVDRTAPQRFVYSKRERGETITALLKKNEGDGGRRSGCNAPRTQGNAEWIYKDEKPAGKRYRQYPKNHDVPNPTRPMARTQAQLKRSKWGAIEETALHAPRKEEAKVYPPVRQSIFLGENQYQSRMMAARNNVGGLPCSASPQVNCIKRVPLPPPPKRQGFTAKQRVPLLGPMEIVGRYELLVSNNQQPQQRNFSNRHAGRKNRFSMKHGPVQIPQGARPASFVVRNEPPDFQNVERYGGSLKHGRNDRVGLWKSPLTKRY